MAFATEGLLAYCRPGFEAELAAELNFKANAIGLHGYIKTERNSGLVQLLGIDGALAETKISLHTLIFARQLLVQLTELRALDPKDRISAIIPVLQQQQIAFGDVIVEHPDGDHYRSLSTLARSFTNALRPALRQHKLLTKTENSKLLRLHLCLLSGQHALLAYTNPERTADEAGGIMRLRFHDAAPSRSALKLEEALLVLLSDKERKDFLRETMNAADLGAAPGGWTWVLSAHGIRVHAIDNGPMQAELMASGLVQHERADGFRWQPPQTMDWMVCDMVESPSRVAELMGHWLAQGWCHRCIFNLKLPMKKRWEETRRCLEILQNAVAKPLDIRAKQLYHDREEITVYAALKSKSPASTPQCKTRHA